MIQEIKTDKFEGILVKVKEDTIRSTVYMGYLIHKRHNLENGVTDEQLADYNKLQKYLRNHKPENDYKEVAQKLPAGQWKLIGNPFELSKEEASEIVQQELIGGIGGVGMQWLYPDYCASNCDGFENPVESFNSLLKSLQVYKENPHTKPEEYWYYKRKDDTQSWGDYYFREFKKAEERAGNWVLIQKIG